jgi:hypothetical protein
MSINLKLIVQNKEYTLLEFSYSLKQDTDNFGRPCSDVKCGFINLLIDATNNTRLIEKISETGKPLQGRISFYDTISDQKVKEIEFSNAHIIHYEEMYNTQWDILCKEKMIISAQNITIGKERFSNKWLT